MNLHPASPPTPPPVHFVVRPSQLYVHDSEDMAREHAARLEAMTGDQFTVVAYGARFRVVRVDPAGKKVD